PNEFLVVGLVIDGDYLGNVKDSVTGAATKFNWMGTVRGRAGILVSPRLLAYGTGGLAFAKGSLDLVASKTLTLTSEDVRLGYIVGAGTEYRFNRNWSVFGEWTWANFDKNAQFAILSERSDIHKLMGGINFKFH